MDGFDYEEMVQEGLRGAVREALRKAARDGLPGAHHFYIGFRTDYPGVRLADYLKDRHPEEMTIVLQHQFWGLDVNDKGFAVTLSFSDSQEQIYIPFHALVSFMDPYAKFGLQFTPPPIEEAEELTPVEEEAPSKDKDGNNVVTLDTFRKK